MMIVVSLATAVRPNLLSVKRLSVTVRNLDTNRVELSLDDKRAVLSSAVSGSGERYVSNRGLFGKGAEWHQKGSQAFFSFVDPYGNKVDTFLQSALMTA